MGIAGLALPVNAMNVKISGEPCSLTVYSSLEEGAASSEVQVTDFELYGYIQGDRILIEAGDSILYVDKSELQEKLPDIPVDSLPVGEGMADINAGSQGEAAMALQQSLINIGYPVTADGVYGEGTASAVRQFQESHRLIVTGNADVYTQLLIKMEESGLPDVLETVYPTVQTPESKFELILSRTDADLSPYMGSEWRLEFDEFENFGFLDPSIQLGSFQTETPDIDRINMELSLKIVLAENEEDGRLELRPAVVEESEGAYRPYMQAVFFSSDETSVKAEGGVSAGEINGASILETGYVYLTDEMLAMLKAGTLQRVHLKGKNTEYDFTVSDEGRSKGIQFAESIA